jgi:hypothetical protein
VFLCHSSKDKPFVRTLASRLRTYGVRVWLDEAEIRLGDSLTGRIGSALDECDYVAVVLSSDSVNSEWVQRELQVALHREFEERKVVVLPLVLQKVRMPSFLRDKLYADFTEDDDFEGSFRQVLKVLGVSSEHLVGLQAQNFRFHSLHHFIEVLDAKGHRALWRKVTSVTPLRPGIDLWRDEQFHGSGRLKFLTVQPGNICEVTQQGATASILSRFDPAPECGKPFTRTLVIEATRCFTEESEDFAWALMSDFDEFGVHICLPIERPFKEKPTAHYMLSTQEHAMEFGTMDADMARFDLTVTRPIQGAKYLVRWRW